MIDSLPETYIPLLPEVEAFLSSPLMPYIDGKATLTRSERVFETLDPSSGRRLAEVGRAQREDADAAVLAARTAFDTGDWWLKMSPSDRSKCIWRLAELMEQHADVLAQLDALDNGKPVETARTVDVPLSAEHLYYYAGWPSKIEGSTVPLNQPNMLNYTLREPVGVVGLISPWNYPLLMATWKFAPALAAGNCVIVKPRRTNPTQCLICSQTHRGSRFPTGGVQCFARLW